MYFMMLHSFTVDQLFKVITFINIDEISKVLYYELKIGSSPLVELDRQKYIGGKKLIVANCWKFVKFGNVQYYGNTKLPKYTYV